MMTNQEITLDELIQKVRDVESRTAEQPEVTQMITTVGQQVIEAANSGKVKILTDYDADGITSAYIMETLLKSVNPDCEVSVQCNDRRGAYGLSPDVQGDGVSRYIVCDMGSNQLPLARERLGENVIMFDHHLIVDEQNRLAFQNIEQNNACLCNPHALHEDDSENAQYCAAGLVYRAYQEVQNLCKEQNIPFHTSEKQENTVLAVACIGTVTDMVSLLDEHSLNREIVKNGMKAIDNAEPKNFDGVIGYVLTKCGLDEKDCTAKQLAFNVGAFLNSASRMSEIMQENGAQRMYQALMGGEKAETYFELDDLLTLNKERKDYVKELQGEDFRAFADCERQTENHIAVYLTEQNTPSAFCGLVAGKLTESTDKAILCLTYHEDGDFWSGSGRNAHGNTSLKQFLDWIAETPEMEGVTFRYGGHEDAVGISRLDNCSALQEAVQKYQHLMERDDSQRTVLKLSQSEISSPETLDKLKALEPVGMGLKIPPVVIEGKELYKAQGFVQNRQDWKRIKVKGLQIPVSDWSYAPEKYPQKSGEIKLLAEMSISNYGNSSHVELSAVTDRAFLKERQQELEQKKPERKPIDR